MNFAPPTPTANADRTGTGDDVDINDVSTRREHAADGIPSVVRRRWFLDESSNLF